MHKTDSSYYEILPSELECWVERDLKDEISPQGQLFDTFMFTDREAPFRKPNYPLPQTFCFGEPVPFGSAGLGQTEIFSIETDFSWKRILEKFDIPCQDVTPGPAFIPRFFAPGLGQFQDGPGSYAFGEGWRASKFEFVAERLGIADHPDRDAILLEWFTEHNEYGWEEKYRQRKLPI